jgi:predicted HTH transcriptional regulator
MNGENPKEAGLVFGTLKTVRLRQYLEHLFGFSNLLPHMATHGRIANLEYQQLFTVSKPTASRDLEQLRSLGLLAKVGRTGKGTHYVLNPRRLTKGSKGSTKPKGS